MRIILLLLMGPVAKSDFFLQIACLTESRPHSAVAICALLSHALLARSYQSVLNLLSLPIVFSLYRSSVKNAGIAVVTGRVRVTHKWPQRLSERKRNKGFAVG